MDNKKKLIIGGSIGATLLVALVVVSIVVANRPSALIVRAFVNTISDAKKIEAFDVADDVINGGSIAVSADLSKVAKDDISVEAKLYTDFKDLKGAYEMTLKEDDSVVLNSRITANQDKYSMVCPELFDGAYGVNLKNLPKNLPGSIFDPDEETDFSLTDSQFDYLLNLKDTVRNDRNLQRDIFNMTSKYRKLAIERLVKYSDVKKSGKTITIGDEKIPCTVVSLSINEESYALAMQDLIKYAENDKDLEKLLYRIASNGSVEEEADEYVDRFFDSLDDLSDELDDIEDLDVKLDFYITRSGRRLAQLIAEYEYKDEEYEVTLSLGKNVSTSKLISLEIVENNSKDKYSLTYTVKENNSRTYEATLVAKEVSHSRSTDDEYTDETAFKVEWDKKKGDLTFKCRDRYDTFVVRGNMLQKGDKYIFVLTNVRDGDEPVPAVKTLHLTVTIDRHDPAPGVSAGFTEITKMDKREFKHFTEDIKDGLEEFWKKYI